MIITKKTIYRVITLITSAMLIISIIGTGFTSYLTGVLTGVWFMSLLNDDVASYEYKERKRRVKNG